MKVGLLIIATNKYKKFIPQLIESADKHFLNDEVYLDTPLLSFTPKKQDVEVIYHIFTDDVNQIYETDRKVKLYQIDHKPWPLITLGRYETFFKNKWDLLDMDYLYYCDVDMTFVSHIGQEILSKRVGTIHPGYVGTKGTPERNPNSKAYISEASDNQYFAGGFNGGESSSFIKMASKLHFDIIKDINKGIKAIWDDESYLNRYFFDNKPTKVLDPGYCYPENNTQLEYTKKLLALDKDHNSIRSDKCGVILFHKNIKTLYTKRWVDRCLESIINQSYTNYKVYEVNYGSDDYSLVKDYSLNGDCYNQPFGNHADAMNFIIDKAFEDDCDVVFNVNLDDYYDIHRFSKQLDVIKHGYDVVSSDFVYIKEMGNLDINGNYLIVSDLHIKTELDRDNNVIAHPCVCFNRRFWESNRYDSSQIPREDLDLWKRGINLGFNFFIIKDTLLFYRIHDKQITSNERRN